VPPAQPQQVAPGVTVTDMGPGRKQQQDVGEAIKAYNDMYSISNALRETLKGGIDYADQAQKGRVTAGIGKLMGAIAIADQKGVLQPGEAEKLAVEIGDPTSFTSYVGNQVGGAFDPLKRLDAYLGQRLDSARASLAARAKEAGIDESSLQGRISQPKPSSDLSGAPARPKSEQEYNSLPSGALYIGPDGKTVMRKP
jgi:hypothetical protein